MAIWHRLVLHGPEQHWHYRSDLEWLKGHRCMAKLNLKKTGRPQRTNIELEWLLPSLTLILSPLIAHLRHNIPRNIRTHKPCISYVRDISQPCLRQTHRICSVSCSSPAAPAVEESMIFFKRFVYTHQSHCVSDPGWFFWQMMWMRYSWKGSAFYWIPFLFLRKNTQLLGIQCILYIYRQLGYIVNIYS